MYHAQDSAPLAGAGSQAATGTVVIRPSILYFGTPVVLISTLNPDGSSNLSPISSAWALGDRVVLGLGAAGQGCLNLLRTRECVINLPSPALHRAVEAIGRTTGRADVPDHKAAMGYVYEPDKFGVAGLTPAKSETVRPDRVSECPLQLEAELLAAHAPTAVPGEPEAGSFHILETRVRRVHAHSDVVIPGSQHIDTERWSPLLYVFRHYFGTAGRLGRNFRAET